MKLVLDIDGVIANFAGCWKKWLREEKGIVPPVSSFDLYDFYTPIKNGLALWDEFYHDPAVVLPAFAGATPLTAAADCVYQLSQEHDVSFATYRPEFAMDVTIAWLEDVIDIKAPRVHHVKDKSTIEADFYVDDHGPTVEALLAAGKNAYVFDQPWNRDFDVPRIANWFHLCDVVRHAATSNDEVRTVNATTGGQKGSKLARFDLVPPGPLWELAELYGKGAKKYAERNWELGFDWHLAFAAMQRHAWLFWQGEDVDPETGCPHMAAVAFHAFTLMEFPNTHPELDDRPGGPAPRCADGSRVHDFKGQPVCPACGFTGVACSAD